jgi:ELWxxDGT repeat protein
MLMSGLLIIASAYAQSTLISIIPKTSINFTKVDNKIFFTSHDSLFVLNGNVGNINFVKSGLINPDKLFASNGILYFVASGNQLWKSNGTGGGTFLLKNFSIGNINYVQTLGSNLYFTATETATGQELYRTNGTVAGTILLKDIFPGSGDGVGNSNYLSVGSYLYFPATNSNNGMELWRTDGTASGTILLKDVNPGPASGFEKGLWAASGTVYFSANDGTHGIELWKTNGTSSGTLLVKDVNPGAGNGFFSDTIIARGGNIYFFANETTHSFQLWKSNSTSSGTVLVKEFDMVNEFSWGKNFLYADNSLIYFYTYDNQVADVVLWKSDGTSAGTVDYYTINSEFYEMLHHTVLNSKYFAVLAPSSDRVALLVTDGTAGGTFTEDVLYTGETYVFHFNVVNNNVIFGATGQNDHFLGYLKSDGTPAGTYVFYRDGFNRPSELAVVGNYIFFTQDLTSDPYGLKGPVEYKQLFISDLTNTNSLRSLYGISMEGSANPINLNNVLYYTTYNDSGFQASADQTIKKLWKYNPAITSCFSEGGILQQVWNNIPGNNISAIPLDSVVPSATATISIFEGTSNLTDSYGARYRGYLCVPVTGAYTFWIASNDKSELWLSSDALPENKVKIAYVDNFTNSREWNKYPSQQSASINLVAGRRYYIEALHKENSGNDNLAVGWRLPNGTLERPIAGSRLSPYENSRPGISFFRPLNNQTFIAPESITLRIIAKDLDGNLLKVEAYADNVKLGEASNTTNPDGTYSFTWNTVSFGSHILTAKAYDNEGGVSSASIRVNIQSDVTNNSFTLINADTDQDIRFMSEGEAVYLNNYSINIRYNATHTPGSVKFLLNGTPYSSENVAPYALAGDQNGNYNPWTSISEGSYTLEAREYSNSGGTGTLLKSSIIHFEVVRPDGNLPPVVNGGPNLTIQLPQNSVNLNGSAYDPDGSVITAYWNLVSAPADIPVVVNSNGVLGTASYLTVPGTYVFQLNALDNSNIYASDEVHVLVTSPTSFVVSHFTLVNAETDETIYTIYPGQNVNIPTYLNYKLNIVAHTYPSETGCVYLNLDGYTRTENVAPYSLFGDNNGDYNSAPISAGLHTIIATPYSGPNRTGIQGPSLSVPFNMINPSVRVSAEERKDATVTCYPNPSGGNVNIQLTSEMECYGKVEIYDAMGRLLVTLFEGNLVQGEQLDMNWNGADESKGLYFLNTSINNKNEIHKIILK